MRPAFIVLVIILEAIIEEVNRFIDVIEDVVIEEAATLFVKRELVKVLAALR
jgi:hypothetical protein